MTPRLHAVVILAVCAVLAARGVARADEPWADGVSEDHKAAAEAELALGNQRFVEADYRGALEHYRAAIASWDHPAIRFNIVRCLIQLERPIEASDELKLALKYGAAPLEDAVYHEALSYQKLLASQIGELELRCDRAGIELALDGKHLATCPYAGTQRLVAGPHQLVAQRAGFLGKTLDLDIAGAKHSSQVIELTPLTAVARVEHRVPQWLPWAVFGGGLAVAGIGGLLEVNASGQFDSYDRTIASECAANGCASTTALDQKQRAQQMNTIAVGVMTAGAVAVVTGGVLLVLNRGRTVYAETGPAPKSRCRSCRRRAVQSPS